MSAEGRALMPQCGVLGECYALRPLGSGDSVTGKAVRSDMGAIPGPRRARWATAFSACAVLLFVTPGAKGDDRVLSPDAERQAIDLYREGVSLAREGRWKEAESRFERVTAIRAAPPVLFALGRAQIENGRFATAKATFERAVHSDDPQYAYVVEQATEQLRLLAPRIPRVVLDFSEERPDTTTKVDGASMGATRVIELDCCSPHEIVVSAPGRRAFMATVTLNEGEERHLRPSLAPEAAPKAALPAARATARAMPAPPVRGRKNLVGPLVLGSAGVVAGVVGVVVRAAAADSYDRALASCRGDPPLCSSQSDVDAGNAARDRVVVGTVTAALGFAAVAGAGVWWALSGPKRKSARVELGVTLERQATIAGIRGAL